MRTMYIILSWAGWAWAAVAIPVVVVAVGRRRRRERGPQVVPDRNPQGFPVVFVEGERRP